MSNRIKIGTYLGRDDTLSSIPSKTADCIAERLINAGWKVVPYAYRDASSILIGGTAYNPPK